ncbi:VOC family protein [Gramella jeungdoensis]|uniref:VOC family protein n=1 Tax=Gramella jeungdoensis TaxID=708091 RepID=A0ABT0YYK8_9FLAO|nr:VOC family protein [Gramella jeungdoensis]MCM8568556.1 VOC family protein [Gramella jeungdoensis]
MRKPLIIIGSLIIVSTVIFGFKKMTSPVKVMTIGVIVSNLEESYKFYTDIIGMEKEDEFQMSSELSTKYGINSGKEFNIINLRMKCDGYSLKYKLNKTVGNLPEVPFKNDNDYYGFEKIGSNYFSIDVHDVESYKERLDENNIEYKYLVIEEWNNYKVILVHDPDGVLLEIRGY